VPKEEPLQGMCKGKGFILITEDECNQKGGKVTDPDQM
jgi:hypothetical protein